MPLLSGAGRDKSSLYGAIHRIYAVACAKLGEDAGKSNLHRYLADLKRLCNLAVLLPLRDEAQRVDLLVGKSRRGRTTFVDDAHGLWDIATSARDGAYRGDDVVCRPFAPISSER